MKKPFIAVTALSALALVACSTGSSSDSTASSAAASTAASSAAPTQSGPTTVRLVTHDSFAVSDALIAQLKKDTDITLEVAAGGDAGQVVAGAILAAGAPSGDVLFGVDNTLISKALDAGVFSPYTSPELGSVVPALKDDTSGGMVTPIDYGDVCINRDDAWFAKHKVPVPQTLDDLLKPEYKDLLVVEDPAASSPGEAFLLATIAKYGDGWKDYWTKLKANGVKVAGSWTDAYEGNYTAGGKGDRPLVVSYATSPPAEIVYASDPKPSAPYSSVMTDGCYRQVEYAGVLAGTKQTAAAQKVVDWLLSVPVQSDVPLSMFVFPAREGIVPPKVFVDFAVTVPHPLQLPPTQVAQNSATWLDDWGTVMGR